MSSGGPRPNSGPKQVYCYFVKGVKYSSLQEAADANGVRKETIHRWCSGKKPDCWREKVIETTAAPEKPSLKNDIPEDIKSGASAENMTPLDYMLKIMNDPTEDKETRIKCGYYALPYVHGKVSEKKGKKQDRQEKAGKAGGGKFKTSAPPLKRVK